MYRLLVGLLLCLYHGQQYLHFMLVSSDGVMLLVEDICPSSDGVRLLLEDMATWPIMSCMCPLTVYPHLKSYAECCDCIEVCRSPAAVAG